MTISELLEKLADPQPGDTFTPSETQQLIDWEVNKAVNSAYTQARIANSLTQSTSLMESIKTSVQTLMSNYKTVPTPQLEVITDESSQEPQA